MTTWLDRRWAMPLLALLAAIPLVWPQTPPLVDVLGHMGRYRIMTADGGPLRDWFSFEWRLLGNLGVDLLMVPLAKLVGVELGTKLVALAIPPLTVAGMLLTGREANGGKLPPAALFALPLAFAYPFQFGFINFSLSVALAWWLLALWLRLGPTPTRAALSVPLACLLWLCHMVGWGLFGLAAFGAEWVRRRRAAEPLVVGTIKAGLSCLPLALPLVAIVLLRSDSAEAASFDFLNIPAKLFWVSSLLRERFQAWDMASAWTLILLIAYAGLGRRLKLDPLLAIPGLLCLIVFIAMPRVAFGSAYADMRLLPFTAALFLLAIRADTAELAKALAIAGLAFFAARTAVTTTVFLDHDRRYRDELRALDGLPYGASVLSLVHRPCHKAWATERLDHLPALAIVRRDAFTNDQWTIDSAQGLEVVKPGVGAYASDPSHFIYPRHCRGEGSDLDRAVSEFNRAAFDHVWVIGGRANAPDLGAVWSNGGSTLYRVQR